MLARSFMLECSNFPPIQAFVEKKAFVAVFFYERRPAPLQKRFKRVSESFDLTPGQT
jgi:hypothetical protein